MVANKHFLFSHIQPLRSLWTWSMVQFEGNNHRIFQLSDLVWTTSNVGGFLPFKLVGFHQLLSGFQLCMIEIPPIQKNAKFLKRTPKDILGLWLEISSLGFFRLLCPCCDLTFTVCLQSVSSILDVLQNEQLQWLDCSLWSVCIY